MELKGITCRIPLELHNRISEEIRETESTISKFIEMVIMEHYEKGAGKVMAKGRTLAFQVSEELFQRVKEYLENYEKNYHRRLTQKEFVISLIEQALEEAEEEFEAARAAEHEEQAENGWEAAETAESDEDEEVSDDEEAEDWDEENGETEGLSADEETAGRLEDVLPPWNVSAPAQMAGCAALEEEAFVRKSREFLLKEEKWMEEKLTELGFFVWPSDTIFCMFEGEEGLQEACLKRGIYIRDAASFPGIRKGTYRIGIRRHEDNVQLLEVLKTCGDIGKRREQWQKRS